MLTLLVLLILWVGISTACVSNFYIHQATVATRRVLDLSWLGCSCLLVLKFLEVTN